MPAKTPHAVVRTCASDQEEQNFLLEHPGYELISTDIVAEGRVLRLRRAGPKPGQWAAKTEAWAGRFKSPKAMNNWLADEGRAVRRRRGMVHMGDLEAALDQEAISHTPGLMEVRGSLAKARKLAARPRKAAGR